jgi:hypothetical protein
MKNVKIEFTQQQMEILSAALVELPFRVAQPLIAHINEQVQKHFDESKDRREAGDQGQQ